MLNQEEKKYYARHISLKAVSIDGQMKLKAARVLCIGAGGLGSSCLYYLAASGIGTIAVMDGDEVEISNLQRQILYKMSDIGKKKVRVVADSLRNLNPHIQIKTFPYFLDKTIALKLFKSYDVIIDCTDNFKTRYLINDACLFYQKPNVSACVNQFDGFCSIYCTSSGPCYRCIYPNFVHDSSILNCSENGILGVVPGILGLIQANETIKLICGLGESLIGRMLVADLLRIEFTTYKLNKNKHCKFCKGKETILTNELHYDKSLEVDGLHLDKLKKLQNVYLIDVRTPEEHNQFNIGGSLIPLPELHENIPKLAKEQHIVTYCQTGLRARAAALLLKEAGFEKVSYLKDELCLL